MPLLLRQQFSACQWHLTDLEFHAWVKLLYAVLGKTVKRKVEKPFLLQPQNFGTLMSSYLFVLALEAALDYSNITKLII